ncbi:MAG: hypothetical protein KGL66_02040 [Alphaproteobacteria bacterium]|nr:hypothetical protein [Alphaproteobacteria bacterium]
MPDETSTMPRRTTGLKDPVVRMIVTHWALGAGLGALAAAGVLLLNIGDIRTLLAQSDIEWAGALLLFTGFMVTFGSVVAATAVMFNPVRADRDAGIDPETNLE